MPAPYNYAIRQPDASSYFDAFAAGRKEKLAEEQDVRNTALAKYLPGALQGDKDARAQALAAGNPDQQIALSQHFAQMDNQTLARTKDQQAQVAAAAVAATTPEAWAQVNALAKSLNPNAPDIPFEQRDMVIARGMSTADLLNQEWKKREFSLDERRTEAQIRASDASAEAQRASAAKDRASIMPTIGPDGKPTGPTPKLTEGQSKDLGYYRRGFEANRRLTPDRIAAMTSTKDTASRNVPFVGNALQSAASRQGAQAALDFLATILRKDTGAAVTEQEFDFYGRIFIPQWGDDAVTLRQKEQARTQALDSIRLGLGPAQILAKMGYQAPQEDTGAAATTSGWKIEQVK